MTNFWTKLPKPFTVLAPMDDVTDVVFREIINETARPDVFFTEFVSSDGLLYNPASLSKKLLFPPDQHPIMAQIWGTDPDTVALSAKIVADLGFDGIDINMGCPKRAIMAKGGGAGIIGNFFLAEKIINAARVGLPVSVKTRLAPDWIEFLLRQNLEALTIHGRTPKQMSTGQANWEEIGRVAKANTTKTLIIGNGDVKSYSEAVEKADKYGVDGVMIGRGVFADPYVFSKTKVSLTKDQKLALARKHLELFVNTWGQEKNWESVKKFFKIYINGFKGAARLRNELMVNSDPAAEILLLRNPGA